MVRNENGRIIAHAELNATVTCVVADSHRSTMQSVSCGLLWRLEIQKDTTDLKTIYRLHCLLFGLDRQSQHLEHTTHIHEQAWCLLFSLPTLLCPRRQYFYCTDRYSWEWSQDVSQLPDQASDSLCITMDSDVVDGLDNSECVQTKYRYSFTVLSYS